MLMGLIDSAMVGKLGVTPLAAAAFANTLVSIPLVFGIGLMLALGIRISQAHGAAADGASVARSEGFAGAPIAPPSADSAERVPADIASAPDAPSAPIGELLRHGMALALGIGLLLALGTGGVSLFLHRFGQPDVVADGARPFLLWLGASLPFVLLTFGLKNFCEALENPWPPTLILTAAVPLNVLLNWFLIYGNMGAPALGLTGAGVATFAARAVALGALWFYVAQEARFAGLRPRRWRGPLRWAPLKFLLELGLPSAMQIVLEVGAFSAAAIMVGWIGAPSLAAHQIVLACAGTTFMVPLGLSMAAAIRVGAVSTQPARARAIGVNGLRLALLSAGTSATFYLIFRHQIAGVFVDDAAVRGLAATLFLVVAIFQVVDGLQVMAAGLLRGLSDATFPMLASLAAYWAVGLPFGYVAAFVLGWGAVGVWIGLAIALALTAGALTLRFLARAAGEVAKVGGVLVSAE